MNQKTDNQIKWKLLKQSWDAEKKAESRGATVAGMKRAKALNRNIRDYIQGR